MKLRETPQQTLTCSKSTVETLEKDIKYIVKYDVK